MHPQSERLCSRTRPAKFRNSEDVEFQSRCLDAMLSAQSAAHQARDQRMQVKDAVLRWRQMEAEIINLRQQAIVNHTIALHPVAVHFASRARAFSLGQSGAQSGADRGEDVVPRMSAAAVGREQDLFTGKWPLWGDSTVFHRLVMPMVRLTCEDEHLSAGARIIAVCRKTWDYTSAVHSTERANTSTDNSSAASQGNEIDVSWQTLSRALREVLASVRLDDSMQPFHPTQHTYHHLDDRQSDPSTVVSLDHRRMAVVLQVVAVLLEVVVHLHHASIDFEAHQTTHKTGGTPGTTTVTDRAQDVQLMKDVSENNSDESQEELEVVLDDEDQEMDSQESELVTVVRALEGWVASTSLHPRSSAKPASSNGPPSLDAFEISSSLPIVLPAMAAHVKRRTNLIERKAELQARSYMKEAYREAQQLSSSLAARANHILISHAEPPPFLTQKPKPGKTWRKKQQQQKQQQKRMAEWLEKGNLFQKRDCNKASLQGCGSLLHTWASRALALSQYGTQRLIGLHHTCAHASTVIAEAQLERDLLKALSNFLDTVITFLRHTDNSRQGSHPLSLRLSRTDNDQSLDKQAIGEAERVVVPKGITKKLTAMQHLSFQIFASQLQALELLVDSGKLLQRKQDLARQNPASVFRFGQRTSKTSSQKSEESGGERRMEDINTELKQEWKELQEECQRRGTHLIRWADRISPLLKLVPATDLREQMQGLLRQQREGAKMALSFFAASQQIRTLVVTSPLCELHPVGGSGHEASARLPAIMAALEPLVLVHPNLHIHDNFPEVCTRRDLLRVHSPAYLDKLNYKTATLYPSLSKTCCVSTTGTFAAVSLPLASEVGGPIGVGEGEAEGEGTRSTEPASDDEDDEDDEDEDEETVLNAASLPAAMRACSAVCYAVDKVMAGLTKNAFCVVRPPGHHAGVHGLEARAARNACGQGFCLLNNVAVGVRYWQAQYPSIRRIAIIDWDAHHGNGTEEIFEGDASVLFVSLHEAGPTFFPQTGLLRRTNPSLISGQPSQEEDELTDDQDDFRLPNWGYEGGSRSETFDAERKLREQIRSSKSTERGSQNVICLPLGKGSGGSEVHRWWEEVVVPAVRAFCPDALIISAGFDAHALDDISSLKLSTKDFGILSKKAVALAEACCAGRLISVLEGGYHLSALASSCKAHTLALLGVAEKDGSKGQRGKKSVFQSKPGDVVEVEVVQGTGSSKHKRQGPKANGEEREDSDQPEANARKKMRADKLEVKRGERRTNKDVEAASSKSSEKRPQKKEKYSDRKSKIKTEESVQEESEDNAPVVQGTNKVKKTSKEEKLRAKEEKKKQREEKRREKQRLKEEKAAMREEKKKKKAKVEVAGKSKSNKEKGKRDNDKKENDLDEDEGAQGEKGDIENVKEEDDVKEVGDDGNGVKVVNEENEIKRMREGGNEVERAEEIEGVKIVEEGDEELDGEVTKQKRERGARAHENQEMDESNKEGMEGNEGDQTEDQSDGSGEIPGIGSKPVLGVSTDVVGDGEKPAPMTGANDGAKGVGTPSGRKKRRLTGPKRRTKVYEVEQVCAKRDREGQPEYLIKWKRYPDTDNTWEPLSSLIQARNLVEQFERTQSSQARTSPVQSPSPIPGESSS